MNERVHHVDQSKAIPFDWGSIQWLCSEKLIADAQMTFGYVEIKPGVKNPLHQHPNCDEVLYLIAGELDHSLDGEVHRLTPGASIHIPRGVKHDAVSRGGEVARMVVAYSSGDRQTEMLEEGGE